MRDGKYFSDVILVGMSILILALCTLMQVIASSSVLLVHMLHNAILLQVIKQRQ